MTIIRLHPGRLFQPIVLKELDRGEFVFGAPGRWQALFVFRGQHCPICKSYLGEIARRRAVFDEIGVSIAAVSADSAEQTHQLAEIVKPTFPLLYGLDESIMRDLGLYISDPRSAQETDHRFPEPALFVVNPHGALHLVEIANAPFLRPDLDRLTAGLRFVIEKNYPIRGTAI